MLAFRYLMAVSTGAVITLGYCLVASSQETNSVTESKGDNSTALGEEVTEKSSPQEITAPTTEQGNSTAIEETETLSPHNAASQQQTESENSILTSAFVYAAKQVGGEASFSLSPSVETNFPTGETKQSEASEVLVTEFQSLSNEEVVETETIAGDTSNVEIKEVEETDISEPQEVADEELVEVIETSTSQTEELAQTQTSDAQEIVREEVLELETAAQITEEEAVEVIEGSISNSPDTAQTQTSDAQEIVSEEVLELETAAQITEEEAALIETSVSNEPEVVATENIANEQASEIETAAQITDSSEVANEQTKVEISAELVTEEDESSQATSNVVAQSEAVIEEERTVPTFESQQATPALENVTTPDSTETTTLEAETPSETLSSVAQEQLEPKQEKIETESLTQSPGFTPSTNPPEPKPDFGFERTRAPENLNPSGNPLLFPTDPEEVQIGNVYAITLEQVIELARNNNRDFQVAQLQLERTRQGLQQALAAEFPQLSTQVDFTRTDSAQQELTVESQRQVVESQRNDQIDDADDLDEEAAELGEEISDLEDQINALDPLDPNSAADAATLQAQATALQDQADAFTDQADALRSTLPAFPSGDTVTTSLNAQIQLNYDLFTGGLRPAQIKAAEEAVRLQELDVERIAEDTRFDATQAYYNLQDADALVAIQQAAVEDSTQSLRDAQLLEQAGLGTRFDVLRAEVDLANDNQQLKLAEANQRTARRQLAELLSLPQQAELTAADDIQVAGAWELSLEDTIILAYRNRSELEQFLTQRNIDEQQRQIALSALRPQVSLFANYNVLGVLDDDLGPADGFTLGATLQWLLFDGGSAKAAAEQEKIDVEIAEIQFADQRNQIRLEVESAFFSLQANQENIQTATVAVELAEESLRLARLRFQAGVGTQTDVINSQTELTQARGNLLSAIIDYNQALNAIQRAVSNLPDSRLFDLP